MFTTVKLNDLTTIESISNTDQAIIYNQSTQKTGKVSLSDLITAGGGLKTTDIIDVAHGGTGATNKANAVHNLMDANITDFSHIFGTKSDWSQSGSISLSNLKTAMNLSDFKCRYLHWGSSITFPAVNSGFVLINMSAIETFWFPSNNLAHNKIAGGDTSSFTWTHNTTAKTVTISNSSNFTCLVLCV